MLKYITLSALFILISARAFTTPRIHITVDLESAQMDINLLQLRQVTDQQLNDAALLYGNQQLIHKVKSYSGAGKDVFVRTLREMIETGTIRGDDPYNWRGVKAALPEITKMLTELSANQDGYLREIVNRITPYTPDSMEVTIEACFLVGGGALGFTIGNEHTFNVALQKLNGDTEALKLLVAHELYHIVQAAGQEKQAKPLWKNPPYYLEASAALLENLWSEGTATFVGDYSGFKSDTKFGQEQTEETRKNAERRRENFTLFEAILYKCYHDTTAKRYEAYYNVCFTVAYDEAGYFAGYEMARAIRKYKGETALARLVTSKPIFFIYDYIVLCKEVDDKQLIRFDSATEQIVDEIMQAQGLNR